jgi:4-amino-4-deoxy-L-arabinose transferase-like glycosyltransferase
LLKNINSISAFSILLMFVAGCLIPLTGILIFVLTGTDFLIGTGDSDKYYRPAYRLLETGVYGFAATDNTPYKPDLDILPVYPLIIAAVFKLFGLGNFVALAAVQMALQGASTVAIALSARSFRTEWMWPAAILAAVWPNLAYRPTTIMNETVFIFFLVWGICSLLWVSRGRHVIRLLIFSGCCFGLAYMTRPILLLFPVLVAPALIYLIKRDVGIGFFKASWLSAIPFLIMLLFTTPQYIQSYNAYGELKFTIQRGHNALFYLYPCLTANWGCGDRDEKAYIYARSRLSEEMDKLSVTQRDDVFFSEDLKEQLATELISGLPMTTFIKGVVGSTLKSLFHNVSYEVIKRFGNSPVYFGDMKSPDIFGRIKEFGAAIVAKPWMWIWCVFQAGLFFTRGLQIASLLALRDNEDRARIVLLVSMIIAFVAVSVGFGSVRYRVALEPELILLTLVGWSALMKFIKSRRLGS